VNVLIVRFRQMIVRRVPDCVLKLDCRRLSKTLDRSSLFPGSRPPRSYPATSNRKLRRSSLKTGISESSLLAVHWVDKLPKTGMRRSLWRRERLCDEKAYAGPHRGSTPGIFQGWDNDRYRPWGCLEPLLHAQRRWRSCRPGQVPNESIQRRQVVTDLPRVRIAMEAGTHSIWISEQLQGMKSSWPTCANCGRSRTAIVRATRWMLGSWLAFRGSIRKSSGPLRTAQSLSKKPSC
jgi:hypothetical protein